jgi:hypothetical protein
MKTQKLLLTFLLFFVISWPSFSFATSGCCSHHGGVCGCNTSTGSQSCCDGTDSPSCGCQYIPPVSTSTPKTSDKTYSLGNLSYGELLGDIAECKKEKNNIADLLKSETDKYSESKLAILEKNKVIDNQNIWLGILIVSLIISVLFNIYKSRN